MPVDGGAEREQAALMTGARALRAAPVLIQP
jgi:hypothetical protein